jgi:hypothetical protein
VTDLFGHVAPATEPPDGEAGREERGAFYTPELLALAMCRSLAELFGSPEYVFEPGCGGGAFLRAVREVWPKCHLLGVDLMPACDGPGLVEQRDLFTVDGQHDLVIGNPDFGIAERVVRHGIAHLAPHCHVAMLLRLTILGSETRVPFHREHPLRYLQPIAQRPAFKKGGTSDPTEYGMFVWEQGFKGRGEILPPLVWHG